MTDPRQRAIESLFKELLALPHPAREEKLAARADLDPSIIAEVRSLLAFAAEETGPLEAISPHTGAPHTSRSTSALAPGQTIGHYKLIRQLGEGGMGVVFLAEQERPRRVVAIKIIRPECATPAMLKRFEFEAEVLGRLQHPGIAQVIEAGIGESADSQPGRPFLAMELVDGEPITSYATTHNLSIRQRVALFIRVCEAVEHAHLRGVIHRDLKPANIYVTSAAEPKVLDFGVARAVTANDSQTRLTIDHAGRRPLIGTLAYMSPEQVSGSQSDIDTRSDVYSLGIVLFELLTGAAPYTIDDRSMPEVVRVITEVEPRLPSSLEPTCRGDLDTIILKSLEKDRDRRYQSAAELASDLRRYLSDTPILARPPSAMYQVRKFAKRNRNLVAALAIAAFALIAGFAGTLAGFVRARHDRDAAQRSQTAAESATRFVLEEMIDIAAPTTPDFKNIKHADVIRQAAKRAPERFASDARAREQVLTGLGISLFDLGDYKEAIKCFTVALAAAEETYGPDSGQCVRPHLRLATAYDGLGLHTDANEHRARAIQAANALPPNHIDALDARGAVLYMSVAFGAAGDAEDAIRRLLAEYNAAHLTSSQTYRNLTEELVSNLLLKGRSDDAIALQRSLIEDYKQRKGPLHAETLTATVPLIETLQNAGYAEDAASLAQQTLADLLQIYDVSHIRVLYCRQALADILLSLDRNAEALDQMQECMKYAASSHPNSELEPVKYQFTLAMALCENGRAAEALPYAQKSYDVQRDFFGESHDVTLDAWFALGRVIAALPNRADEGLDIMRRSIRLRAEKKLPVTISHFYLAHTLDQLGRLDDAIAEQQLAVEGARHSYSDTNPFTRRVIRRLADFLDRASRHEEATTWRNLIH